MPPIAPTTTATAAPSPPAAKRPPVRKRLVTAFMVTPLLAGFYPAIFLAEPSIMPISLALSYASTIFFGLPLVIFLDRRGVREWWIYLLGGAVCALPTVLLYALAPLPEHLRPFGPIPVLGLLFWGASSGVVFWMIGIAGDSPVSLRSLFHSIER